MTKTSPNPTSERDLLWAALDLPPEKRVKFLQDESNGDAALLDRLLALIQNAEAESLFMAQPAVAMNQTAPMKSEVLGTRIGRYKLMEQVGEGGMGIVFVAEQTEPVRRTVALKLIKPGMDTKQVIARFEAERQALALMDHANIARVLDAGTTGRGLPYFVMELVRGLPITEYCDKAKLSPRDRLRLFTTVCSAVQHAHLKGIIHRDLKPNNILVTLHDGVPVVKVIDFGVAKALHQQLTQHTVYTALNQVMGTPMYMSPEQLELSGLDIDTRTDVYSLGVLLYELLTGVPPFEREVLYKSGLDELRRIIREQDPLRPSQRVTTLDESAKSTNAMRRGLDQRTFSKTYRGELDWIVMKALEKDRNRRYESASAMAADVQRYLVDEPIEAKSPTTIYQLKKFVKRNRAGVLILFLFLMSCFTISTISLWQTALRVRAERLAVERKELARRAVDEMYTEVAENLLQDQADLNDVQRNFLGKALTYYELFSKEEGDSLGATYARLQATLRTGVMKWKLNNHQEAENTFASILAECKNLRGVFPSSIQLQLIEVETSAHYANLLIREGKADESSMILQDAFASANRLIGVKKTNQEDRITAARAISRFATSLGSVGNRDFAGTCYDAATSIWRELANEHQDSFDIQYGLARAISDHGSTLVEWGDQFDKAKGLLQESHRQFEDLFVRRPTNFKCRLQRLKVTNSLSFIAIRENDRHSALPLTSSALDLARLLAVQFPMNAESQEGLHASLHYRSLALHDGKLELKPDVEALVDEKLILLHKCVRDFPGNTGYASYLIETTLNKMECLALKDRLHEAIQVAMSTQNLLVNTAATNRARHQIRPVRESQLACMAVDLLLQQKDFTTAEAVLDKVPLAGAQGEIESQITGFTAWTKQRQMAEIEGRQALAYLDIKRVAWFYEMLAKYAKRSDSDTQPRYSELVKRCESKVTRCNLLANDRLEKWKSTIDAFCSLSPERIPWVLSSNQPVDSVKQFMHHRNFLLEATARLSRIAISKWVGRPTQVSDVNVTTCCLEHMLTRDTLLYDTDLCERLLSDLYRINPDDSTYRYYNAIHKLRNNEFQQCYEEIASQVKSGDAFKSAAGAIALAKLNRIQEARESLGVEYRNSLAELILQRAIKLEVKWAFPTTTFLQALDRECQEVMAAEAQSGIPTTSSAVIP